MPIWTDAELRSAIEGSRVGAITLDTSIFDSSECNLHYKLFTSLKQFSGTGVQFCLVDVICGEVKSHISARASAAASQLRAAAREFREAWRVVDGVDRVMDAAGDLSDAKKAADDQLDGFQLVTGFRTLRSSELVDLEIVLNQYFEPSAPFAASAEKKSEFPDAIALNALEAWGAKNETFVVVVSRDKGWSEFAASSNWLVFRTDLRRTLGAFNSEDSFVAKAIIAAANKGKAEDLSSEIEIAVARHVDSLAPVISAETAHYYEDEFESATVLQTHPIDVTRVAALDSDDNEILISFDVVVDVEIDANFTFYVQDEGDDIPFASASASRVIELRLPVTAAVVRDMEDMSVLDLAIEAPASPHVDFGYVEPDYGGDEDYAYEDPEDELEAAERERP
jgi:hypothetical protein